jgi:hypothetical protein
VAGRESGLAQVARAAEKQSGSEEEANSRRVPLGTSVTRVRLHEEDPEAVTNGEGGALEATRALLAQHHKTLQETSTSREPGRTQATALVRCCSTASLWRGEATRPQKRRIPQGRRPIRAATWIDRPGWPPESPVTLAGDGALRFFSFAPPETDGRAAVVEHGYPRPAWLSWSWRPLQRSCCHTGSALVVPSAPPSPFETTAGYSLCNLTPRTEVPEDPLVEFASPSEPSCFSAARAPVSSHPLA